MLDNLITGFNSFVDLRPLAVGAFVSKPNLFFIQVLALYNISLVFSTGLIAHYRLYHIIFSEHFDWILGGLILASVFFSNNEKKIEVYVISTACIGHIWVVLNSIYSIAIVRLSFCLAKDAWRRLVNEW